VLAIPVVNDHSVDGELDIVGGRMSVSNFSANAAVFTPLDGVSYGGQRGMAAAWPR